MLPFYTSLWEYLIAGLTSFLFEIRGPAGLGLHLLFWGVIQFVAQSGMVKTSSPSTTGLTIPCLYLPTSLQPISKPSPGQPWFSTGRGQFCNIQRYFWLSQLEGGATGV